jgi:hypothetical protein
MREPRYREAPKVFADIIDFACDLDRTFFATNASLRFYIRPYLPGEFWPHDRHVDRALTDLVEHAECAALLVQVTAIDAGRRLRRPLFDLDAMEALGGLRSARS